MGIRKIIAGTTDPPIEAIYETDILITLA